MTKFCTILKRLAILGVIGTVLRIVPASQHQLSGSYRSDSIDAYPVTIKHIKNNSGVCANKRIQGMYRAGTIQLCLANISEGGEDSVDTVLNHELIHFEQDKRDGVVDNNLVASPAYQERWNEQLTIDRQLKAHIMMADTPIQFYVIEFEAYLRQSNEA